MAAGARPACRPESIARAAGIAKSRRAGWQQTARLELRSTSRLTMSLLLVLGSLAVFRSRITAGLGGDDLLQPRPLVFRQHLQQLRTFLLAKFLDLSVQRLDLLPVIALDPVDCLFLLVSQVEL